MSSTKRSLAVGIDLGNTSSAVGVVLQGKVEIIADDAGQRSTPSYVAFCEREDYVGQAAKDLASKETLFDSKRLLGRRFDDPEVQENLPLWPFTVVNDDGFLVYEISWMGNPKLIHPEQVTAKIVRAMKWKTENSLLADVTKAVVTVPAYFNDSQKHATRAACKLAGIGHNLLGLEFLNEPTAAAMAFGFGKGKNATVLVFDLGGVTLDVSVLQIQGAKFDIKALGGDTHLGGRDFDALLLQYVLKDIQQSLQVTIGPDQEPEMFHKLRRECEVVKQELSIMPRATISVYLTGHEKEYMKDITRTLFEEVCTPLFVKIAHSLPLVLADAKVNKSDIDDVVLVGGSTRIPKVRSLVQDFFDGKEVNTSVNPDEAVVQGAAMWAAHLASQEELKKVFGVTAEGSPDYSAEDSAENNSDSKKEQQKRADMLIVCRDCGNFVSSNCLKLAHSTCSLRELGLELAAPQLKRVQSATAAVRKVVHALQDAEHAAQAQLRTWRALLQQVEEAERMLRALDDSQDLRIVKVENLRVLEELQDAASLLEASCGLHLKDKDGTEWKGDLLQGGRCSLLSPLLLHLHETGDISKFRKPEALAASDKFRVEECRNVKEYSLQDKHSQELEDVLKDPELDKVKKLDGLDCKKRPDWCKVLLQRVAPRVQWLRVANALREHVEVTENMPALRHLFVHMNEFTCVFESPDLPLQLEDLEVWNVSHQQFQSLQRLPNLRKLTLVGSGLDMEFPPLPQDHCGLQWLRVYNMEPSTVLSLAKAHAATLQELSIVCDSKGSRLMDSEILTEGLRQCDLVALRRVLLRRSLPHPFFPKGLDVLHDVESCRLQKSRVGYRLLAANSEAARVVTVLCEMCDKKKCPAFPELGDFTWRDV